MALGASGEGSTPAIRCGLEVIRVLLDIGGCNGGHVAIFAKEVDGLAEVALHSLQRSSVADTLLRYPDTDLAPTEVTFRLSPSYGLLTAVRRTSGSYA